MPSLKMKQLTKITVEIDAIFGSNFQEKVLFEGSNVRRMGDFRSSHS